MSLQDSQMSDVDRQKLNAPFYLAGEVPNIFAHLLRLIRGQRQPSPFPYIRHVNQKSKHIVQVKDHERYFFPRSCIEKETFTLFFHSW